MLSFEVQVKLCFRTDKLAFSWIICTFYEQDKKIRNLAFCAVCLYCVYVYSSFPLIQTDSIAVHSVRKVTFSTVIQKNLFAISCKVHIACTFRSVKWRLPHGLILWVCVANLKLHRTQTMASSKFSLSWKKCIVQSCFWDAVFWHVNLSLFESFIFLLEIASKNPFCLPKKLKSSNIKCWCRNLDGCQ